MDFCFLLLVFFFRLVQTASPKDQGLLEIRQTFRAISYDILETEYCTNRFKRPDQWLVLSGQLMMLSMRNFPLSHFASFLDDTIYYFLTTLSSTTNGVQNHYNFTLELPEDVVEQMGKANSAIKSLIPLSVLKIECFREILLDMCLLQEKVLVLLGRFPEGRIVSDINQELGRAIMEYEMNDPSLAHLDLKEFGLFHRVQFYAKALNLIKIVRDGTYALSLPALHHQLLRVTRIAFSPYHELSKKEKKLYAHFSVPTIFKAMTAVFPKQETFLMYLDILITTEIRRVIRMKLTPENKVELICILGALCFAQSQIQNEAETVQAVHRGLPRVLDAFALIYNQFLPRDQVLPKLPMLGTKPITMKRMEKYIRQHGAIEQYNLKGELKSGLLRTLLEFSGCIMYLFTGPLDVVLQAVPDDHSARFSAFQSVCACTCSSQNLPMGALNFVLNCFTSLKSLSDVAVGNPTCKECLAIKRKFPQIYQAIFGWKLDERSDLEQGPKQKKSKKQKRSKTKTKKVSRKIVELVNEVQCEKEEEVEMVAEEEVVTVEEETSSSDFEMALVCLTEPVYIDDNVYEEPEHIKLLLGRDDQNIPWDPRYIAYAYLMIGNHIYHKYLKPLLEALCRHYGNLKDLFKESVDSFTKEMESIEYSAPQTLRDILWTVEIPSADFLFDCLAFYKKRLNVAHPHRIRGLNQRVKTAKAYLSMLYEAVPTKNASGRLIVESYLQQFGFIPETDLHLFLNPLAFPSSVPCLNNINFDLAIIGISELFSNSIEAKLSGGTSQVNLSALRNKIAHRNPKQEELKTYILEILDEHQQKEFLLKLIH